MAKKDKPKKEKNRLRARRHKRGGSAGGASPTRFYPRYGDRMDQLARSLHNVIVEGKVPPPNNGAFGAESAK